MPLVDAGPSTLGGVEGECQTPLVEVAPLETCNATPSSRVEPDLHSSGRGRSSVASRSRWFVAGALTVALLLGCVVLVRHLARSAPVAPAFTPIEVLPGSQDYLFTKLSVTDPSEAPGAMSNDPTGSCGTIWHLPSGNVALYFVVVQPMKVSASSA